MIERCETEPRARFEKNPWISPPSAERPCDYERDVSEWIHDEEAQAPLYIYEMFSRSPGPVAILGAENIEEIFGELSSRWKEETWFLSSVRKRMSHPAYLMIIGMGAAALPYIFKSLREEPDHWFGALEAITRENPAPHAENMYELRDAWLDWALLHGY